MTTLFFSYSHKDEAMRNELETHLALLKRQGRITAWHDRRISAGTDIHRTISQELEEAEIILLLVSANFLASDYCYDTEMNHAIEKHNGGLAVVIPVILHPCDWHSAPFGHLRATPTDGKPVSMHGNAQEAFSIITKDIREAIEARPRQLSTEPDTETSEPTRSPMTKPRSSNLAIKRSFNDHEKDEFLEDSYEYIARFFAGSLEELEQRNSQIQARFKRIDNTRFTGSIYSSGTRAATCSIWFGGTLGGHGICYSNSDDNSRNSFNEMISVVDDGYSLALAPMGMQSFENRADEALSQQGVAEHLWSLFIRPLQ
ncbi:MULTISPECIES: toll/interleukin-1 receptor domain-containing protein [Halomonadaceae]|uniref:Toll/interleukin-1 receptor domain-containing protein n=2 Tax=Vreelandella TaxID=3137766 RepID=A0A7Z0RXQ2_9GAMM|nr:MULTISPECIES: toll/interleukin-1 receptor domain-containing protein [Halomonas]NYS77564.1 toll/interleukin-1 receptor domain-containing protein [Halomonas glaciei]|tara:strand:+ start:4413 stop:5357 length:945 start_codon:yes stop_codon:yes gene_type:complete